MEKSVKKHCYSPDRKKRRKRKVGKRYYDTAFGTDFWYSIINSFSNAAGFVSQYLISIMLDMRWNGVKDDDGSRVYRVEDYNFAFSTLTVCIAGCFIVSLFLRETYGKPIDYSK